GAKDRALPVPAVQRGPGLHRSARTVREARRHREVLQGSRRGQARRPARAGLLHGGRHRRGGGQGQEAPRGRLVAERLTLELATPTRMVVTAEVDEVVAPGSEGYFGVLPGHAPLLATLGIGELTYRVGRDESHVAASGGFAEVRNDKVIVLADSAELPQDIDRARAERARDRAEAR